MLIKYVVKHTDLVEHPNTHLSAFQEAVYIARGVDARIAGLTGALGRSQCPYPIGDDNSVDACIKAGKCGCENKSLMGRSST